uniref:Glycoprotein n=1 Tax=Painter's Point virus TaxID=3139878 RepID=A0AAN0LND2_9VIRU
MNRPLEAILFVLCFAPVLMPPVLKLPGGVPKEIGVVHNWGCVGGVCRVQCNHISGVVTEWNYGEFNINDAMKLSERACNSMERDESTHDSEHELDAKKRLCLIKLERNEDGSAQMKIMKSKGAIPQVLATADHKRIPQACPDLGNTPEVVAEVVRSEVICDLDSPKKLCPVRIQEMLRAIEFVSFDIIMKKEGDNPEGVLNLVKSRKENEFRYKPLNPRYLSEHPSESLSKFWEDYSEGNFKSLDDFMYLNSKLDIEEVTESNQIKPGVEERSGSRHIARENPTVKEDEGTKFGLKELVTRDHKTATAAGTRPWNHLKRDYTGYVVNDRGECKLKNKTNLGEIDEEDKMTVSMLSNCRATKGKNHSCRCLETNAPRFLDGSNDICLGGPEVEIEEVERSYHERMDLCMIYCTVNEGNTNTENRPVFRTVLYRTPFQSMRGKWKSGLEDYLARKASSSDHTEKIAECWPEEYSSYLHDSSKRVMRRAFEDKDNWCAQDDFMGTRDTIEIPSSCLEEHAQLYSQKHLKLDGDLTTTWVLCSQKVELCYRPACSIQMKSTALKAEVTMKSSYAKYTLRDGAGNSYDGYFEGEKVVEIQFEEPGQRSVHGMCNQSPLERKVILSVKEYCDEKHSGPSGIPMNIYCKRPKLIKITGTILLISLILHMGRGYMGTIGASIGTLIFVWITWAFLGRFQCQNCCCMRLSKKSHECRNFRCKRCLTVYCTHKKNDSDRISISRELQIHMKNCERKKADDSNFTCALSYTFDVIAYLVELSCRVIPVTGGTVACIILLSLMWHGADGKILEDHERIMKKALSDMSEYIERLESEGFHPYNARFTPGLREDIEAIRMEKDCATKVCSIIMTIRSSLQITKGREFGFRVFPKDPVSESNLTYINVNVKFMEPVRECQYKNIYKTGKVVHRSVSGDTCTEGCGPCLNHLRGLQKVRDLHMIDPIEHLHENSASWGCDGPGCMAINQGCTCGLCWCELENEEWEVKEVVLEKAFVTLCFQFGSEGLCKKIGNEERGKDISVVKGGELVQKCPKRIACSTSTGECRSGEILGLGDFGDKFGSVKLIGGRTLFKAEVRAQEQCLFAKHRWFEYKQCCKDTYHLVDSLQHVPFSFHENSKDKKTLPIEDAGEWTIEMTMPPYRYMKEKDVLKLESLSIDSCHGCHSCEEGGSCLLHYSSNFMVTPSFECEGAQTDISHITLNRGLNKVAFNIYSKKKEGEINCTIGGFKAHGKYTLVEPPKFPHGDGVIKMDSKKAFNTDCREWLCGWNPFTFNLTTIKGYISIFLIILVASIVLYIMIKVCGGALGQLNSGIKEKAAMRNKRK